MCWKGAVHSYVSAAVMRYETRQQNHKTIPCTHGKSEGSLALALTELGSGSGSWLWYHY